MVQKYLVGVLLGLTAVACVTGAKAAWFVQNSTALKSASREASSRVALAQWLPAMRGDHLRTTLVEVTYPPGGHSSPHLHPCPVIGFVLTGALRFQVDGGSEQILQAGQSFYEAPNSHHLVSANASTTEPAKFLAYFVCEGDQVLTKPLEVGRR